MLKDITFKMAFRSERKAFVMQATTLINYNSAFQKKGTAIV